jgi:hypothetical protein
MEEVRVGRRPKSAEVREGSFEARASWATGQAAAVTGVSGTTRHNWLAQSGGVRGRQRRPRSALRLSILSWLNLVRRPCGLNGLDCGGEVTGYWVGGGDGVAAGVDLDGAVAAGGLDESLDAPAGFVLDPAAGG